MSAGLASPRIRNRSVIAMAGGNGTGSGKGMEFYRAGCFDVFVVNTGDWTKIGERPITPEPSISPKVRMVFIKGKGE